LNRYELLLEVSMSSTVAFVPCNLNFR
jgi:hypothetical protein